jgi:hypothetical protein
MKSTTVESIDEEIKMNRKEEGREDEPECRCRKV